MEKQFAKLCDFECLNKNVIHLCVCVRVQVSWRHLCRSTQKGDIKQSVHSTEQSLGVIGKPMSPFIARTLPQTHLQTYTLKIKTFK